MPTTSAIWCTSSRRRAVCPADLLGVNPFDQPGVEAYKKNMFALLGKPGYEARRAELEERMK